MKISLKLFGIILGLTMYTFLAQAQEGMKFFHGTWEEALQASKKERKLIFVDAYTVWCGPCKAMARNTFPNAEVGKFFNENFINYQYDMEKGEGISFAQKYEVNAYPTLLFINYKGDVIFKTLGYKAPNALIAAGREAVDPKKNEAILALEYEAGTDDPQTLFHYAMSLKKDNKDFREAADKYFSTQEENDLMSDQNWAAIQAFTNDIPSVEYQCLLDKQKKFMKKFGIQEVADKIYSVLKENTLESAKTDNPAKYQAALDVAMDHIKDDGQTANRLRMLYAEATGNWQDYAFKTLFHFEKYVIIHPKELDLAARNFYNHIDDPAKLEVALDWARQSVAIENEYYNNDTYAHLLYKLGKYEEAKKFANKALRIAILNQKEAPETEALLEKLREIR
ncbi:MAG: thioredoxin family protein [Bacteroidia bacterium]